MLIVELLAHVGSFEICFSFILMKIMYVHQLWIILYFIDDDRTMKGRRSIYIQILSNIFAIIHRNRLRIISYQCGVKSVLSKDRFNDHCLRNVNTLIVTYHIYE